MQENDADPEMSIHRRNALSFYARDKNDAQRQPTVILGIKVYARTDDGWDKHPCPRASQFVGVYLPDELPELYPADCPDPGYCCCVLREMVLTSDFTEDAETLRARITERGLPEPPLAWGSEKDIAELEEKENKMFAGKPEAKAKHFELVRKIVNSILKR